MCATANGVEGTGRSGGIGRREETKERGKMQRSYILLMESLCQAGLQNVNDNGSCFGQSRTESLTRFPCLFHGERGMKFCKDSWPAMKSTGEAMLLLLIGDNVPGRFLITCVDEKT